MPARTTGLLQRALLLTILAAVLATAFYFTFRRTLIADLLESAMQTDTADPLTYGAALFQTRGCSGCHTLSIAGSVGDTGPDLTGIHTRHDSRYIRASIESPNAIIAANCPEEACQPNIMPDYGSILDETQINALVTYLVSQ